MKKNLAKAMAAAMTVGAVVPMATQTVNAAEAVADKTVDVRTATTGEVLVNDGAALSRTNAYDTKGTAHIGDDTLKASLGTNPRVIATQKGVKADLSDEMYVIATKATVAQVNTAKAELDTAKAEIEQLKKDGYTIKQEVMDEMSLSNGQFTEGRIRVTATKSGVTKIYDFKGIDNAKKDSDIIALRNLFLGLNSKLTTDVVGTNSSALTYTLDIDADAANASDNHEDLNRVKYLIEKNVDKFDIVKYEDNNNADLKVVVYEKGVKKDGEEVIIITLKNFAKVDKDLVANMPLKSDFSSHWAKAEIEDAMLKGWVDASATFRPNAGVTRAEFAKMMCTILDIDTTNIGNKVEPFADVNSSQWYYKYIVALYNYQDEAAGTSIKKGAIINGYDDNTFKPNAAITREEAAKMIAAAYEIQDGNALYVAHLGKADNDNGFFSNYIPSATTTTVDGKVDITKSVNGQTIHRDIKTKFKDDKDIAAWADEAVAVLSGKDHAQALSILGGNPDGTFAPKSNITRAETLVMLKRAQQ